MKLENPAIDHGQNILEFQIFYESFLIAIKSWKGCTNLCVSDEEILEYAPVLAGEL